MRFTYKEPSGTWGVHGEEFKNMSDTIYGAMCKLLDYEETGLSPDDVKNIQLRLEEVHIGTKIQDYEVFGIFNGFCIAFNWKASDPYVVWTIDDDKCGVHNGRYYNTKEKAVRIFDECAFNRYLSYETDLIYDRIESMLGRIAEDSSDICLDVKDELLTLARELLGADARDELEKSYHQAVDEWNG